MAWASVEIALAIIVAHGGLVHESFLRPVLEILFHGLRLGPDVLRSGPGIGKVLFCAAWDAAEASLLVGEVGKGGGADGQGLRLSLGLIVVFWIGAVAMGAPCGVCKVTEVETEIGLFDCCGGAGVFWKVGFVCGDLWRFWRRCCWFCDLWD